MAEPMATGQMPQPVSVGGSNGTYRGIGGDWFNAEAIAREDWLRGEQSAILSHDRQKDLFGLESAFNAAEAEKQRAWEEKMSSTAYTRAVQDMKQAGLNPILAYSNGAASTPTGSAASSSAGSSSPGNSGYKGKGADTSGLLGNVISLVGSLLSMNAGLYAAKLGANSRIAAANIAAGSRFKTRF